MCIIHRSQPKGPWWSILSSPIWIRSPNNCWPLAEEYCGCKSWIWLGQSVPEYSSVNQFVNITRSISPSICSLCKSTVWADWHETWYKASFEYWAEQVQVGDAYLLLHVRVVRDVKFCPFLLCVKFLDFGLEHLQNYHFDPNRIWNVGTYPKDVYESRATSPSTFTSIVVRV